MEELNGETTAYLQLLDDMIAGPFDISRGYLKSVRKYINEHGRITEEQKKAVNNIYARRMK